MRRWSDFVSAGRRSRRRIDDSQPDWTRSIANCADRGDAAVCCREEHRGSSRRLRLFEYCELYRAWEGRLSPTMRQLHVAGERLFVDYAGATLGASVTGRPVRFTSVNCSSPCSAPAATPYAEATFTQRLVDWIARTCGRSLFSAASRRRSFRQLEVGVTKRASTSRR